MKRNIPISGWGNLVRKVARVLGKTAKGEILGGERDVRIQQRIVGKLGGQAAERSGEVLKYTRSIFSLGSYRSGGEEVLSEDNRQEPRGAGKEKKRMLSKDTEVRNPQKKLIQGPWGYLKKGRRVFGWESSGKRT